MSERRDRMAEASAVEYRECPACTELRYHQGGSPGDRDDHWHCDGCGFWGRGEGCFPACELASPPSGDVRLCRHVAALALDCICGDRIPGEVTTGTCQACPVPALVEAVRAAEKALPSRGFVEGHEDELPEIMAAFRAGDAALARLDALRAERGVMDDDFTRYGREWYAQLQDENRTLRSDLESAEAEATALRMMGVHLSPDDESLHVECRKREAALQERVGRAVALIGGDHWSMADWRLALAILRGEEGTDGNE